MNHYPLAVIHDDSIRLGQFLKLAGLAESGGEARELIADGDVTVNDATEVRRGRQLVCGDIVAVARPSGLTGAIVGRDRSS